MNEVIIAILLLIAGAIIGQVIKHYYDNHSLHSLRNSYKNLFEDCQKQFEQRIHEASPRATTQEVLHSLKQNTKNAFSEHLDLDDPNNPIEVLLSKENRKRVHEHIKNMSKTRLINQLGILYIKILKNLDEHKRLYSKKTKIALLNKEPLCMHQDYFLYIYLCTLDESKYQEFHDLLSRYQQFEKLLKTMVKEIADKEHV